MRESLTFTWHDTLGEALPSPTTKKRFEDWQQTINEAENFTSISVYYLDFISDVISELENQRDLIIKEEKDNWNKPIPQVIWNTTNIQKLSKVELIKLSEEKYKAGLKLKPELERYPLKRVYYYLKRKTSNG